MARTYVTIDGDMIDLICYRAYEGRQSGMVEAVLEANRTTIELADRTEILPRGLTITLPDIPRTVKTFPIMPLWD
jgi:phage tail protein X